MATEKELRSKVATWLNDYKGIAEGSTKHKELINIFNDSGLCTRYKMTTSDAWCAMAVSDAFIATGLTSIFPCVECGCSNMITLAQKAGIWVEDDSYKPGIGDVIMYDWQDSGSGDNTGTPDHVGIVQAISGNSMTVIEGNKSDTVGTRSMTVNGKYIRGYITPDYTKAAGSGSTGATGSTGSTGGTTSGSGSGTDAEYDESLAGKYTVSASSGLNIRKGAGTKYDKVVAVPKGTQVQNYGYYGMSGSTKWLYVQVTYGGKTYEGYASSKYLTKSSSSSSSGSSGSGTTSSSKKPSYKVGTNYTTKVDRLNVRKGPGTNYATVGYSGLTSNGKLHAYSNGSLEKGTTVTCKAIDTDGSGNTWIQIPSGWIAAYYEGQVYVG